MSRRRHHTIALVCMLAGCGRFGFGDQTSVDAMTESDATPASIVPLTLHTAGFSTMSTAFVDVPAAQLTLPPSVGKRWLVVLAGAIESSMPLDTTVEAIYLVDGMERGLGATQNTIPGRPGPWQHFVVIDGTSAPQQITFQLREAQGGTAKIDSLDVVALPLDPSDLAYASNDAVTSVTSLTRAPAVALSLGELRGDYVFMMLANATDLPGASDVYVEWEGPSGEPWFPESQQPREPRQSFFTMQRTVVDTPNAVVTLYSHGGSGPGELSYARVVALRVAAFASVDFAADTTGQVTLTSMLTQTLGASVTPGASQYLFVGSMRLGETCNATQDADRTATFVLGQVTHSMVHETDNCAYEATYGHVELVSAAPSNIAADVSSGNGFGVQYYSSELLMLGLR